MRWTTLFDIADAPIPWIALLRDFAASAVCLFIAYRFLRYGWPPRRPAADDSTDSDLDGGTLRAMVSLLAGDTAGHVAGAVATFLRVALPRLAGLLVLTGGIVIFVSDVADYHFLLKSVRENAVSTVEGPVRNLKSYPKGEHMDVGAVHFDYSDFDATFAFHNGALYGGPMRENLYVRIRYIRDSGRQGSGNRVVHIDVRRP